MLALVLIFIA